ncbi:glutamine synthetase III [Eubacteriales bacterium KG127]
MDRLENFGKYTFDKNAMKKKLPYPVYLKWKNAIRKEDLLDKDSADIIAHAMKEWAIENGATHYCHWFQPLNGVTAKKHESFIDKSYENLPIVRFSGDELLKSEPDASSFPNGGMRSTFEARGYTYWDCTANAFIMDNILYISSIFVSFDGISLDKKAPLLKSIDFISKYATELYNLFFLIRFFAKNVADI